MTEPRRDPSTAASLARLYDVDLLEDPGDVGFYLALASSTGGPILEIAAGSGRVALPLAEAGYDVTLVDIDAGMLARAKAAAGKLDPDAVSYTHLRAHETRHDLVCRLLLEKKK